MSIYLSTPLDFHFLFLSLLSFLSSSTSSISSSHHRNAIPASMQPQFFSTPPSPNLAYFLPSIFHFFLLTSLLFPPIMSLQRPSLSTLFRILHGKTINPKLYLLNVSSVILKKQHTERIRKRKDNILDALKYEV